jgi:cytochrome c oxidase subunit 2
MFLRARVAVAAIAFALLGQLVPTRAEQAPTTITVHAKRFSFLPAEITVKKGQPVKLVVISDDVPHSLVVKDLNVNVAVAKSHSGEASFTPEKTGDFKGMCGRFCGMGHGSMQFTVHVTDK